MHTFEPPITFSAKDLFRNPMVLRDLASKAFTRWEERSRWLGYQHSVGAVTSIAMDKCGRWCVYNSPNKLEVCSSEWHPQEFSVNCFIDLEKINIHVTHHAEDLGKKWDETALYIPKSWTAVQPADWWNHQSLLELQLSGGACDEGPSA